jgi:hypothetical protein
MHECSPFLVAWLTRLQIDARVSGSVGEIGVHHGKFFLALATVASPTETLWAIDVFDLQELNPDQSGRGDVERFLSNADAFGVDPSSVRLFQTASDALAPSFLHAQGLAPVRMASIDGGHSAQTTCHDLVLISCALADGGIVIVDDYLSHGWPGVTDGLFRFLLLRNHSLAPFLEVRRVRARLCLRRESTFEHFSATRLTIARESVCARVLPADEVPGPEGVN